MLEEELLPQAVRSTARWSALAVSRATMLACFDALPSDLATGK